MLSDLSSKETKALLLATTLSSGLYSWSNSEKDDEEQQQQNENIYAREFLKEASTSTLNQARPTFKGKRLSPTRIFQKQNLKNGSKQLSSPLKRTSFNDKPKQEQQLFTEVQQHIDSISTSLISTIKANREWRRNFIGSPRVTDLMLLTVNSDLFPIPQLSPPYNRYNFERQVEAHQQRKPSLQKNIINLGLSTCKHSAKQKVENQQSQKEENSPLKAITSDEHEAEKVQNDNLQHHPQPWSFEGILKQLPELIARNRIHLESNSEELNRLELLFNQFSVSSSENRLILKTQIIHSFAVFDEQRSHKLKDQFEEKLFRRRYLGEIESQKLKNDSIKIHQRSSEHKPLKQFSISQAINDRNRKNECSNLKFTRKQTTTSILKPNLTTRNHNPLLNEQLLYMASKINKTLTENNPPYHPSVSWALQINNSNDR